MYTYYLTAYQFNRIKNRVPHANPIHYKEDGVLCVKVQMNPDIFTDVATKEGWI